MNEGHELRVVFEELRAQPAPPHNLHPGTLITAGRRAGVRRRVALIAAGGVAIVAIALPVALSVGGSPGPVPLPPGDSPPAWITPTPEPPASPLITPSDSPRSTPSDSSTGQPYS
jgi:hypothetical protein